MPKARKNYTTPHVYIPINNPRRNISSEQDQNARYRLQQSVLDSFHAEVYGPVFLSICHATGVEEDPMMTQNIRCLWRGGGAALIQIK